MECVDDERYICYSTCVKECFLQTKNKMEKERERYYLHHNNGYSEMYKHLPQCHYCQNSEVIDVLYQRCFTSSNIFSLSGFVVAVIFGWFYFLLFAFILYIQTRNYVFGFPFKKMFVHVSTTSTPSTK